MIFSGDNLKSMAAVVKEVYDQHIIIATRFDALKDSTERALDEHRRLTERLLDKFEEQKRQHEQKEQSLLERLVLLEAKLGAFSEQAMRQAVTEVAEKFARARAAELRGEKPIEGNGSTQVPLIDGQ